MSRNHSTITLYLHWTASECHAISQKYRQFIMIVSWDKNVLIFLTRSNHHKNNAFQIGFLVLKLDIKLIYHLLPPVFVCGTTFTFCDQQPFEWIVTCICADRGKSDLSCFILSIRLVSSAVPAMMLSWIEMWPSRSWADPSRTRPMPRGHTGSWFSWNVSITKM